MNSVVQSITSAFENIRSPLLGGTPRLGSGGRSKHQGVEQYDEDGAVFDDMESLMKAKEGVEGDDEGLVIKAGKRVRRVELRIGGMTVSISPFWPHMKDISYHPHSEFAVRSMCCFYRIHAQGSAGDRLGPGRSTR